MDKDTIDSDDFNDNIFSKITSSYRNDIIKEAMKTQFANSKIKITEEVLSLINEISKAIVVEAALRAAKQSSLTSKKVVQLDHVEAILPQMMLDVP